MRILTCILTVLLCGCVTTPKISQNDLSAKITVSTSTFLEKKSIHPDEFIYVHAFTLDQTGTFDRAKNVTILKPEQTEDSFYLDSQTPYRLEISFISFGFLNKTSCLATLNVTPAPLALYQINLDVNDETNSCSLIFEDKDNVLVDKKFTKQATYYIPIIIPM